MTFAGSSCHSRWQTAVKKSKRRTMVTKESKKIGQTFCRFAERAQTDFGVNAVINWAKESNLGPEVGEEWIICFANPALGSGIPEKQTRKGTEDNRVFHWNQLFRTFSYLGMWTRCCLVVPSISWSGVKWRRTSSQVTLSKKQSNKSCVRGPLDANWEPRSSPSYRLPCPWKTSHFQPAHYLQGAQANLVNCFN